MTLKEAINHIDEVIKDTECEECKKEHIQLKTWLIELQEFREQKEMI
ncbi:hypothetical protein HMPREF1143_1770 [Peptoanaerobacter stomatis]|uniref:Uncharacterized protein n=1 Tax=Peptoanaerobacter stomatis TaxID=796937 RepID=J6HIN9_9FIRM|nr:hypothetical protein [Peptoanaerobacter stomatis]EJU22503.1 hypothetical protein HMPREF1143_1770 [Peptoanaerobacter stomatis]